MTGNEELSVRSIKAKLKAYGELERDIDNQIERLERLETKMYTAGSPIMSDMPHAATPTNDRMSMMIAQRDELKDRIMHRIEERKAAYDEIENHLAGLYRADQRAIIRMRYLDGETWDYINRALYGNQVDYQTNEDTYMRKVMRLHGLALVNMVKNGGGE